ncbi:hypothetical protein [Paraflavitalea sp. CAU 1676]|uniref:hypothetical protein n=1 Tax=Paraflavitalea sp. CAU 1676 TaxID=3032598 RepID=UPI0023DC2565|nr:hypothetical protein [Paraflavitalea sp. CAU 1676]MDF2188314.1 hypothetical protein [Paraflavitalea sp. CAU 1676]
MIPIPDLLFIASILLLITSVTMIVFLGKKFQTQSGSNLKKLAPLFAVGTILFSVIVLTYTYSSQLDTENEKYAELESRLRAYDILINDKRNPTLDSLKYYKSQVAFLIKQIEKQEYVSGKKSEVLGKANELLKATNAEIINVSRYNEVVNINDLFPNLKGTTSSAHNSSSFQFSCPTDTTSSEIELKINITNPKLIKEISCLYLQIVKVKSEREYVNIFTQSYKPKIGINYIGIPNFFKESDILLSIGYLTKLDSKKEYPWFEKINCHSNSNTFNDDFNDDFNR